MTRFFKKLNRQSSFFDSSKTASEIFQKFANKGQSLLEKRQCQILIYQFYHVNGGHQHLFWLTFWKIQNKIKICHELCNFHFPSVNFYRSCQFLYRSCESRDSRDRSRIASCRNLIIRIFQNVPKMTDFDKNLTKDDHKTKYPPIFLQPAN